MLILFLSGCIQNPSDLEAVLTQAGEVELSWIDKSDIEEGFIIEKSIDGRDIPLSEYRGKIVLVVNCASNCGFTPQYEGLQKLHETYSEKGLVILGFPCNQFGSQEPGDENSIQEFCQVNYGVTFQMFAKVDVNGRNADPLFKYLKKTQKGLLGSEKIKWNFTKFLVNREGKVVARFAPTVKPKDLVGKIKAVL